MKDMKKKILIISAVFPPEQVTSAFLNYDLAKELSKKYFVTVLRPYPTRPVGLKFDYDGLYNEPFETILIDSYTYPQSKHIGRFRESVDFGKKCASYIQEHHYEISFVYNNPWQLFGVGIVAKVAKKYGIPYMVAIQDIFPECLLIRWNKSWLVKKMVMGLLGPIDKYYQKNAARIRTISEEMGDYLSATRKIPRERYLIVNNWQNDEDYINIPNDIPTDKMSFVFAGSINLHANVDMMIKAFSNAKIANSELVIYGGGSQKDYCVSLVKELGLDNVKFSFVKRDQIPLVQSKASVLVFALPSGNGKLSLPSKMTSYMLSGKPILASVDQDSSSVRYINESHCGIAVTPDSIMAMTEGFRKMASMSKEQLQTMGNNSREYAMQHLTREYNLKLVIDAIENEIKKV